MSEYKPKHLSEDTLEARIREAGRKVLCGSLSFILASSLVPVMPSMIYAESNTGEVAEQTEQVEESAQNEASTSAQEQVPVEDQASRDEQAAEEPAQKDEPGEDESAGAQEPANTQKETTTAQQMKSVAKAPVRRAPAAESAEPSLSANLANDASLGESGSVDCYASRTVEFTIAGEALSDSGTVTLSYTLNNASKTQSVALTKDGDDLKGSIVLSDPGIYGGLQATVADVTYGEESASFNPGEQGISGSFRIVDNSAPTLESVILRNDKDEEYKSEGETDPLDLATATLSASDPLVLEAKSAQTIVVTVKDDALNTGTNASFVEVVNTKGERVGNPVTFSQAEGQEGVYEAKVEGATGRVALRIVALGYGASDPAEALIGGTEDTSTDPAKYLANGSLVLDGDMPKVAKITADEATYADPNESTKIVTKANSVDVYVSDAWLNTEGNASVVLVSSSSDSDVSVPLAYSEEDDAYKATCSLASLSDGTYRLKVQAKDAFSDSADAKVKERHEALNIKYDLVIDRTDPTITSIKVADEDVEANGKYAAKKLTVVASDTNLDTNASSVTLTNTNTGEQLSTGSSGWNEGIFEWSQIPEGVYNIQVVIKDAAGNQVTETLSNVTIDGDAPHIGDIQLENEKSRDGKKIIRVGSKVTFSVKDLSFNANDIDVSIKRGDQDYSGASLAWDENTASITFSDEGEYTVTVGGKDDLGNAVESTEEVTFIVAAAPVVTVTKTSDQNLDSTNTNRYYNTPVTFDVTIKGDYIDANETYVAGVPLSQADGTVGSVTFTGLSDEEDGVYAGTVTYNEGLHESDLPVVSAKDWYLVSSGGSAVEEGKYNSFTVDLNAPQVAFSTTPNEYANNDTVSVDGKVLFLKNGNLTFTIIDEFGIDSAEISDSNGYDRTITISEGNRKNVSNSFSLSEDHEFTDDALLTVTDLAGNKSVWSLTDTKTTQYSNDAKEVQTSTNDGNTILTVQSPIKLVEDHTSPTLVLSGAEEGVYYADPRVVSLKITERNFGYLREFADTLDVLKVYRRDDSANSTYGEEPYQKKIVKDAEPDGGDYVAKTDTLTDGHYKITADLTDLAGNAATQATIGEFTVDTVAPTIDVEYKANDVNTIKDDGTYYSVDPKDGLTATITIAEHNFDRSKFIFKKNGIEVEPEWKDSVEEDKNTDEHECSITIKDEGDYELVITGEDLAGNAANGYEATFHVDTKDPEVKIKYPSKDAIQESDYKDLEGTHAEAARDKDTDYFDAEPTVTVAITDTYIHEATTTINGITLEELLGNKLKSSDAQTYDVNDGIEYKTTWNGSTQTYTVAITYADGSYTTPMIHAQDKSAKATELAGTSEGVGGKQNIVVDIKAPEVVAAYINKKPADLGNLSATKNGQNGIYFFTSDAEGSEQHVIFLCVNDSTGNVFHGVRSVELMDKTYAGYKLAMDSISPSEDGSYNYVFKIINTLEDGLDFSDEVRVRITDFAGNYTIWSMKENSGVVKEHGAENETTGKSFADLLFPNASGTSTKMNYPSLLVEDNIAPEVKLTENDIKGALASVGEKYERHYNEGRNKIISLDVVERTLKYLIGFPGYAGLEPNRVVLTVTKKENKSDSSAPQEYKVTVQDLEPQDAGKTGKDYKGEFKLKDSFSELFTADADHGHDGHYTVVAEVKDVVGNSSSRASIGEFTIDTTAPEFEVEYQGASPQQTANGKEYFNGSRTATITVNEHNFDADLFTIRCSDASHFYNHEQGVAAPTYKWKSEGDTHTCTVRFPSDGEYRLEVFGTDMAGNDAVLKSDKKTTVYDSGIFVIDTKKPVIANVYDNGKAPQHLSDPTVEFPAPTGTYAGKNYYSHAVRIYTRVKDRNFNPSGTTVYRYRNGSETTQNVSWTLDQQRDADGYEVYAASVDYKEDGNYKTPHVKVASDFSKNTSENSPVDFVVDLEAPTISVSVDKTPTSTGDGNKQKDPIQFYNVATKMTFTMHDDHLLRSYQLDDPEGEYVVSTTTKNVEGKADATLVISLRDGARASNDTEYERDIRLIVQDIAGNRRIWTIDRTGKVVKDEVESNNANSAINGGNVYPYALVQDTTAPVVALSGVTAGTFYNSTQTIRATINEFNYDYLTRFDPARVVMHVTKYEGNAGRAQSSWTVPASSFKGSRPNYAFDQIFDTDGHYEVYAEFLDYANNRSNRASIGEFTIDKTAPTISVSWNSPAGNAPYYRETRVATITVVEHNFDESLFTVDTTGSRSGWTSNGDTHTMTVTFDADGTYALTVNGRDKAGNEAAAYTEPTFYIDKTAPTVTIGGTVQRYGVDRGEENEADRLNSYDGDIANDGEMPNTSDPNETLQDHHAYNGVVMPVIRFRDQSSGNESFYDGNLTDFTLVGGKHGTFDKASLRANDKFGYTATSAQDGVGEDYQFSDFGLLVDKGADAHNVYDPEADDVYTLTARITDKAGNEASASVVFSVNRYGSNYLVSAVDVNGKQVEAKYQGSDGLDYDLLGEPPTIQVTEINVSGSAADTDHSVLKEYANKVSSIEAVRPEDARSDGFVVVEDNSTEESKYGWSEYKYTIRPGNFGEGSDSDTGDGGQGVYRVDVTSIDRASNDTSTASYLNQGEYEEKTTGNSSPEEPVSAIASSINNATALFTLDQVPPVIDELSVPGLLGGLLHVGQSYTATVHITDAITRGDNVAIYVDGKALDVNALAQHGAADGTGTYEFEVPTSYIPFSTHEVRVVVSDGIHADVEDTTNRFMVTILVPEIATIAAIVGAIAGGVAIYRRRKAVAEPDAPGTYE